MTEMTYADWCNLYANRCKKCNGAKYIRDGDTNRSCSCQEMATIKYRYEQIEVIPNSLKRKDWSDFTGIVTDGERTVGKLKYKSAMDARIKALSYCFSVPNIKAIDNRRDTLIVHTRANSGINVVISGDRNSGKTLLANLILKEVAFASVICNKSLSSKWVKSSSFITAARWDNERNIDYDYLAHLQSFSFLAIDGIDNFSEYGHTSPPDNITMNSFFSQRRITGMPLILVCSLKFGRMLKDQRYHVDISRLWGEEFLSLATDSNNVVIELEREN